MYLKKFYSFEIGAIDSNDNQNQEQHSTHHVGVQQFDKTTAKERRRLFNFTSTNHVQKTMSVEIFWLTRPDIKAYVQWFQAACTSFFETVEHRTAKAHVNQKTAKQKERLYLLAGCAATVLCFLTDTRCLSSLCPWPLRKLLTTVFSHSGHSKLERTGLETKKLFRACF